MPRLAGVGRLLHVLSATDIWIHFGACSCTTRCGRSAPCAARRAEPENMWWPRCATGALWFGCRDRAPVLPLPFAVSSMRRAREASLVHTRTRFWRVRRRRAGGHVSCLFTPASGAYIPRRLVHVVPRHTAFAGISEAAGAWSGFRAGAHCRSRVRCDHFVLRPGARCIVVDPRVSATGPGNPRRPEALRIDFERGTALDRMPSDCRPRVWPV